MNRWKQIWFHIAGLFLGILEQTKFHVSGIIRAITLKGEITMLEKLKGIRTYLILGVIFLLGAIDFWNQFCQLNAETLASVGANFCINIQIPGYVYSLLASAGIYTRKLANTEK